jgi:DnaK suppressor protein
VPDDDAANVLSDVDRALGAIDAAMQRLDAGTYGICAACAEQIAAATLEVDPTASRCVPSCGVA